MSLPFVTEDFLTRQDHPGTVGSTGAPRQQPLPHREGSRCRRSSSCPTAIWAAFVAGLLVFVVALLVATVIGFLVWLDRQPAPPRHPPPPRPSPTGSRLRDPHPARRHGGAGAAGTRKARAAPAAPRTRTNSACPGLSGGSEAPKCAMSGLLHTRTGRGTRTRGIPGCAPCSPRSVRHTVNVTM